VALVSRQPPDRAELLADALEALDRDLHVVVERGLGLFRARFESADALRGLLVQSDSGERGTASGVDEDGRLLVRRSEGTFSRWVAGEVHVVPVSQSVSPEKPIV
jgi:biotin-(acetyl-CoA carboxylase) ligase